ncbi:hypothetical protein K432DRAFT_411775 [Lepidopterella palustris CBS 459.81]|uniref:Uncharacterized protein n=1 Tax=Lepidopterella palustris CBS 459.81 TaxID=1314670 RepID=A0A8E2J7M2_9PEZI|nr:hypothetical protein K432DRAFT_411775 [Lepidopterella palustris CBS 459.81]
MSPVNFNHDAEEGFPANNGGRPVESKRPHIATQLSRTFHLRGKANSEPRRKQSSPALATANPSTDDHNNFPAQPALGSIPAPLKTSKAARHHYTEDQMIEFLRGENNQLKHEREYHIQMLGAGTRLHEVVRDCAESLKNAVLEYRQTQKRLNEEYYSKRH